MDDSVIDWLCSGDVAVAYQARRDLLGEDRPDLRARIATEGWGGALLAARRADGHWGRGFYSPKWTSTHYTLLDLRNLGAPAVRPLLESAALVAAQINAGRASGAIVYCDTCINGMALNYLAWFGQPERVLAPFVDFLLDDRMGDGGFNCQRARQGARHSSLHSTISVLEGFAGYLAAGHEYRGKEVARAAAAAREFILLHRFFRSDRTGEVIRRDFLSFPVSPRWYFDILRALDHFRAVAAPRDPRMAEALSVISAKRRPDGRWNANAARSGAVHFTMEPAGKPSRFITLRALRVLHAYGGV